MSFLHQNILNEKSPVLLSQKLNQLEMASVPERYTGLWPVAQHVKPLSIWL